MEAGFKPPRLHTAYDRISVQVPANLGEAEADRAVAPPFLGLGKKRREKQHWYKQGGILEQNKDKEKLSFFTRVVIAVITVIVICGAPIFINTVLFHRKMRD